MRQSPGAPRVRPWTFRTSPAACGAGRRATRSGHPRKTGRKSSAACTTRASTRSSSLIRSSRRRKRIVSGTRSTATSSAPAGPSSFYVRFTGISEASTRSWRAIPGARAWTPEGDDTLPAGVEAHRVERADETLFWIEAHRALVAGDVLLGTDDDGLRVCPDSWLAEEFRGPEFKASLRFLLELPIEIVLVSHGRPVLRDGRDALAAALGR
jgi:hypothetical protein